VGISAGDAGFTATVPAGGRRTGRVVRVPA
jgi:hypothetical protein